MMPDKREVSLASAVAAAQAQNNLLTWRGLHGGLAPERVSAWLTPPPPPQPQGSPSSKRRGPLLQPIIEGETALFFDDIKVKSRCPCDHLRAPPPILPTSPLQPLPVDWTAACFLSPVPAERLNQ